MKPLRVRFVLAILAALLGAPSIASAASNTLIDAHVSPSKGSVTTVFTFTVTYDGHFGATALTVAAGDAVIPLTRTSGTPEAGTWEGSGTLPAGAWAPIFIATGERGAAAILSGPPVTVTGPGSPTATSSPSGGGDGSQPDGGQVAPTDPGGAPTPFPVPVGVGAGDSPAPAAATQTPAASGAPADAPVPAGGSATNGGGATPAPGDRAPASTASDGPPAGASGDAAGDSPTDGDGAGPGAAPAAPTAEAEVTSDGWIVPAADERDDEGDDGLAGDGPTSEGVLEIVLLIALAGVAAIALIGTGLLMAARRRSGRDAQRAAEEARTEAVLHERMLRRARVRLDDDDPIVAAIGGDEGAHRAERTTPRSGPPEP